MQTHATPCNTMQHHAGGRAAPQEGEGGDQADLQLRRGFQPGRYARGEGAPPFPGARTRGRRRRRGRRRNSCFRVLGFSPAGNEAQWTHPLLPSPPFSSHTNLTLSFFLSLPLSPPLSHSHTLSSSPSPSPLSDAGQDLLRPAQARRAVCARSLATGDYGLHRHASSQEGGRGFEIHTMRHTLPVRKVGACLKSMPCPSPPRTPRHRRSLLSPLFPTVAQIPGIGRTTEQILGAFGVRVCRDVLTHK